MGACLSLTSVHNTKGAVNCERHEINLLSLLIWSLQEYLPFLSTALWLSICSGSGRGQCWGAQGWGNCALGHMLATTVAASRTPPGTPDSPSQPNWVWCHWRRGCPALAPQNLPRPLPCSRSGGGVNGGRKLGQQAGGGRERVASPLRGAWSSPISRVRLHPGLPTEAAEGFPPETT